MINEGMLITSSRKLSFGGPVIACHSWPPVSGSEVYRRNNDMPKTLPCGTPDTTLTSSSANSSCWWRWTGICLGWYHRFVVRLFWQQVVQWSAVHLLSISYSLTTFAFRSSEVRLDFNFKLDLDTGGGWVCSLFFWTELLMLKKISPPSVSVVFRRLLRLGSLNFFSRQAIVTLVLKGPPYSSVANCRSVSVTSVLSEVIDRLVSLWRFMVRSGRLPTNQFAYI